MDFDRLTDRERQCLRLIGRAMSHKEVARELDLSDATVKEYLAGARRKLGASTTREAARALVMAEALGAPLQKGGAPERGDAAALAVRLAHAHASGVRTSPPLPPAAVDVADVAAPTAADGAGRGPAAGHRRTPAEAAAAGLLPAAGHDLPRTDRPLLDSPRGAGGHDRGRPPIATDWGGGSNDLGLLKKLGWAALITIVSLVAYGGFTQGLRNVAATLPLFQ